MIISLYKVTNQADGNRFVEFIAAFNQSEVNSAEWVEQLIEFYKNEGEIVEKLYFNDVGGIIGSYGVGTTQISIGQEDLYYK